MIDRSLWIELSSGRALCMMPSTGSCLHVWLQLPGHWHSNCASIAGGASHDLGKELQHSLFLTLGESEGVVLAGAHVPAATVSLPRLFKARLDPQEAPGGLGVAFWLCFPSEHEGIYRVSQVSMNKLRPLLSSSDRLALLVNASLPKHSPPSPTPPLLLPTP